MINKYFNEEKSIFLNKFEYKRLCELLDDYCKRILEQNNFDELHWYEKLNKDTRLRVVTLFNAINEKTIFL